MSMHKNTDEQEVNLTGLEQGQFMNVVITGATQNCKLEFKNAGDTNWAEDPDFDGTHAGGVVNQRVKCLSAKSRLVFDAAPSATYWLSLVWDVRSNF